ncbi:hypothetical protein PPYR_01049 [Photinus pyralis]|uniref:Uncharacterized protein n=1 Tax=Photinus pyralis TaxID=7054 RepID=A0A5N4AIQ0_PHOPY|nr:hypothetical protein PPYR_08195 [Photinus pyralis]KAB0804079.1 hypothetical protein PPYR_01049 [Photinus pyralis]
MRKLVDTRINLKIQGTKELRLVGGKWRNNSGNSETGTNLKMSRKLKDYAVSGTSECYTIIAYEAEPSTYTEVIKNSQVKDRKVKDFLKINSRLLLLVDACRMQLLRNQQLK